MVFYREIKISPDVAGLDIPNITWMPPLRPEVGVGARVSTLNRDDVAS